VPVLPDDAPEPVPEPMPAVPAVPLPVEVDGAPAPVVALVPAVAPLLLPAWASMPETTEGVLAGAGPPVSAEASIGKAASEAVSVVTTRNLDVMSRSFLRGKDS
jgi:hypothetical protein